MTSPKDAIRKAATLGLVTEPDEWMKFIHVRNLSVHDYFSVKEDVFVKITGELFDLVKREIQVVSVAARKNKKKVSARSLKKK